MHLTQAWKEWNDENKKILSSFGIHKAAYYNVIYLLLFGKKKWQSFETLYEYFIVPWNKCFPLLCVALHQAPHLRNEISVDGAY